MFGILQNFFILLMSLFLKFYDVFLRARVILIKIQNNYSEN